MTQHSLIMEYVRLNGSITPAKMSGSPFMGGFFGSETPRRARELRAEGKLRSYGKGKFEVFYLPGITQVISTYKPDTAVKAEMTIEEKSAKLQALRLAWKNEADQAKKRIIEAQGRALKISLEMELKNIKPSEADGFTEEVKRSLYL